MLVLQLPQISFKFLLTCIDRSIAFEELVHPWDVLSVSCSWGLNRQFILVGYFDRALFGFHAFQGAGVSVELEELLDVLVYFFVLFLI